MGGSAFATQSSKREKRTIARLSCLEVVSRRSNVKFRQRQMSRITSVSNQGVSSARMRRRLHGRVLTTREALARHEPPYRTWHVSTSQSTYHNPTMTGRTAGWHWHRHARHYGRRCRVAQTCQLRKRLRAMRARGKSRRKCAGSARTGRKRE